MTAAELMEKLKTIPDDADVVMRMDTVDGMIVVADLKAVGADVSLLGEYVCLANTEWAIGCLPPPPTC